MRDARGSGTSVSGPAVTALETAVYVIPTDVPEADGTLAWDRTTMVLVTARAGGEQGLGWSYASAAAQTVITEMLAGLVTGRSALDTAELYVDANGGYSVGQAVRVAEELSTIDVSWFEEPASSQDLAGLAMIRRQVRPDVAAGEYSWSLADSARLIDAGAVDCLQLDVTRCGGVTEFLRGAALAAAHQLQVSGHCAPNLHAHVGAAVPNLRHVEYFHDHQRIERLFFDGALDPAGGAMSPDLDRPGHGLTLRHDDAEPYRRG